MNPKSAKINKVPKNTIQPNFVNKLSTWFEDFTGHGIENFNGIENFKKWMYRPTDAAALAWFRILFGICMLIDIPEERDGGGMDSRFGDPKDCHFPLFDFIQPMSLPFIGITYFIMWIGALGITLGCHFKISCLMFSISYWYIFLLDKPSWNNHSYLYGLCGIIFLWTDANKYMSLDYKGALRHKQTVPYWNYFLIKFQFFILYFIAGCKKLTVEWLSGYSMTNLGYHWIFAPFRLLLSVRMTEILIIHWFVAIFDFSIAFWMTWKKTRVWATPFMISFHLMNSRLFMIGMFPWVCLSELPLFYDSSSPRIIFSRWWKSPDESKHKKCIELENENFNKEKIQTTTGARSLDQEIRQRRGLKLNQNLQDSKQDKCALNTTFGQKFQIYVILFYCCVQLFLPYSHFITKGYNNWTNGLYGYSWDMMVHSFDTIQTSVKIVDNNNNKMHFLEPYAFTSYDRWTKNADMAVQYAKCIERNLIQDFKYNPETQLTSTNFSIYFEVWCSMNGRFQQRIFKPIDILNAKWSPFEETKWVLPVLHELNHMRPKLNTIAEQVMRWSNYSDCMFVADFPTMVLDNYISTDLVNVTLTVLEGAVEFQNQNSSKVLVNAGENLLIGSGKIHQIKTVSPYPSSYMYTFVNRTMEKAKEDTSLKTGDAKSFLPIWNEFYKRAVNYCDFFYHVGNSFLFLMFGVPMPIRLREF